MTPRRPGRTARRLLRAPARLYDWPAGWLLGHRLLRLTDIDRRAGRIHRTIPEASARNAESEVIVVAGPGTSADRYRNLQAPPAIEVAIARGIQPTASLLDNRDSAAARPEDRLQGSRVMAALVEATWISTLIAVAEFAPGLRMLGVA